MNRIVKYLDNMEMTQKIVKIIPGILLGIYTNYTLYTESSI